MQYNDYYGDISQRGQGADYGQMGGSNQIDYYQGGAGVAADGSAGDSTVNAVLGTSQNSEKSKPDLLTSSDVCSPRGSSAPCWCYMCDKRFESDVQLVNHLRLHSFQKPFHCKKCSLPFMYRSTLKRHENVCGDKGTIKRHFCSLCKRSFTYRHDLKRHCLTLHGFVTEG
ncbi:Zinc finger protein 112-like protein [Plakobranchus ocellatus]|uniref:Zinc finger protein 112-like protein n=1 Tax=Plakobranchus ocellatus TaxID=259542 RepID=A0AAV4B3B4_9GAST|nr:Zinc finger protein 112-like protein [Plakobranchus ocellatus]